jgi:hypothetical protein
MVGMKKKKQGKYQKKRFRYGGKANLSLVGTIMNYFKEPKLVK